MMNNVIRTACRSEQTLARSFFVRASLSASGAVAYNEKDRTPENKGETPWQISEKNRNARPCIVRSGRSPMSSTWSSD